jgi:hypothetical protein
MNIQNTKTNITFDVIQKPGETTISYLHGWWHVALNHRRYNRNDTKFHYECQIIEESSTNVMPRKTPKTYFKWVKLMGDRMHEERTIDDVTY